MFPGLGGMNPKKMQAMMKQLGVEQQELDAERVVVELRDGGKLVVEEPSVAKVAMGGAESLQVSGRFVEESGGASEEDVKMVMEKTGKGEEEVRKVLENMDLAEAIVELS
tara:strand:- start:465 stop:794 length:330 start_codon:yes stop_codon:yes gene_type:complete